jgi:hypothetical protein
MEDYFNDTKNSIQDEFMITDEEMIEITNNMKRIKIEEDIYQITKQKYLLYHEQSLKEMALKKAQYCTGHILNKDLVFYELIRNSNCKKCKHDDDMKLVVSQKKELTQKEILTNEITKLEKVKQEIKYAFTNLLNNNEPDTHVFFNLLYNMQENIITNDISRFKKELENINNINHKL